MFNGSRHDYAAVAKACNVHHLLRSANARGLDFGVLEFRCWDIKNVMRIRHIQEQAFQATFQVSIGRRSPISVTQSYTLL